METRTKNGKLRFRESIYINGRKLHSPIFFRKGDATRWKQERLRERALAISQGFSIENRITVKELIQFWRTSNNGKARRTIDSYESCLNNYIIPFMGNLILKDLKPLHGERFKQHLIEKGLKAVSVNNNIRILKALFNFAVNNENLLRSPFRLLKNANIEIRKMNYWNPFEAKQFLQSIKESPYYSIFLIALNTGMRKSELCGLCWDSIDFNQKRILVNRTRDRYGLKETTKGKKSRMIPMNDIVFNELQNLWEKRTCFDFVFTNEKGKPITYEHLSDRLFREAVLKSGVKMIRFHDLRTTFASTFKNNGGDIYALKELLGHSSVEITQRCYAQLSPSYLKDQASIVNFEAETLGPTLALTNDHIAQFH